MSSPVFKYALNLNVEINNQYLDLEPIINFLKKQTIAVDKINSYCHHEEHTHSD